jgi:DNA-directed RNA polymerase subunit RPC12/RpoP
MSEVKIDCSDCGTPLMVVDVTPVDGENLDYTFVIHCDHCGGKSFPEEFNGLLKVAGTDKTDLISAIPNSEGVFNWSTKKVVGIR